MSRSFNVMGESSRIGQGSPIADPRNGHAKTVPSELSEAIVKLYRGWHAYEAKHSGLAIVDFDLSDLEGHRTFHSREEILSTIGELVEECDRHLLQEAEFLGSRLRGSIFYLRALMGEQIPFSSYVEGTMGVKPAPFAEVALQRARSGVTKELSALGLEYTPEAKDMLEKQSLTEPEGIQREILSQKDLWLGRLADEGIPVPSQMPLRVKFATVDAYWSNWIEGSSRDGLTLTINLHKRVRYDEARALFLCLHEICGHAVQMSIWRHRIETHQISQACGVTTVHSAEAVLAEGLGQTVSYLLEDHGFSAPFLANRAVRYHTLLHLHNAHLALYDGVPVRDLLDQLQEKLPFSTREDLELQLRDRGTNLLFRTYLLSYSIGEAAILSMLDRSRKSKRELFSQIYQVPMTLSQLERFARARMKSV